MAILQHAPVTAACLCTAFVTSTVCSEGMLSIVLRRSSTTGWGGGGAAGGSVILNAVLTTFPMVPCYPSGWSFICLMIVLFHYRHLERQWGSARYLTFLTTACVLGRIMAQVAVPGSTPGSEATRVVTLLALVFPLAALSMRYQVDIPSIQSGALPAFLTQFGVSEATLVPVMTLVLLLRSAPAMVELHGIPRTAVQPVAVWMRIAIAVCGAAFGYLTKRQRQALRQRRGARSSLAIRAMDWFTSHVSTKLVDFVFVPLFTPLCGPATSIVHNPPPRTPNAARPSTRGAVGTLVAGDDDDTIPPEVWAQIVREQQALNAGTPTSPVSPNRRQFPTRSATSQPPSVVVDPAKVALLRELQLGVTDATISEALVVCGGDVESAAAYLMTHHME